MPETINKLQPDRTIHLRGFDRRGSAAALHHASPNGFTLSGIFRDPADFAVLMLWDADDFYSHYSFKYLPDFDFSGIRLDFDLASTNCQSIESLKYPSIDWPYLDYATADGRTGRIRLNDYITAQSGRVNATQTFNVQAGPATAMYDRVTLSFERYAWDYIVPGKQSVTFSFYNSHGAGFAHQLIIGANTYTYVQKAGDSSTDIAAGLAATAALDPKCMVAAASYQVILTAKANTGEAMIVNAPADNAPDTLWVASDPAACIATYLASSISATVWDAGTPVILSATSSGGSFTVIFQPGSYGAASDANMCVLLEQHKTSTTAITPSGRVAIAGAVDPSSIHLSIPFDTAFATDANNIRQMWLTFAPRLSNAQAYAGEEWSAVFSNWSVADPNGKRALKVAHPAKSVRVASSDCWAAYSGAGWATESGFDFHGYARHSAVAHNQVTVFYSCPNQHDLYLGTSLYSDRGQVSVSIDGQPAGTCDCWLPVEPAINTRRLLRRYVPAGQHTVVITVLSTHNPASTGTNFYFDFLEAAVPDDVQDPAQSYTNCSAATDYDTDHGYKLSPQRLVWMLDKAGMHGDLNHYAGVFWWSQRTRTGGHFHSATVTFSGWTGIAENGQQLKLQFGGANQGDAAGSYLTRQYFGGDTDASLAQFFADYINETLVGVWASATGKFLTITSRSPMYDFNFWGFATGTPSGSIAASGDLHAGTEGTWTIDPSQTPALNRAARDWHGDLWNEVDCKGWTAVCSFSQELLNAPDNPPGAVWTQRYLSGSAVLTATGFGTEGAGFVEAVSGAQIKMTGHGYISGNTVNIVGYGNRGAGTWCVSVDDADHFTLGTPISVMPGNFTPAAGDAVNRNLQTAQCAFSAPVQAYMGQVYSAMAGLMNAAGLTPWLQFGEILHWFFSDAAAPLANASNASPIAITTGAPHGFSTGDTIVIAGVYGNTNANGTWTITVTSPSAFTLDGSHGSGAYQSGGKAVGGSMALYDADQTEAAHAALGRALARFTCQDSDPAINSYRDANFLRSRIKDHIDAIRATVLAAYPNARFELLWPYDVNYPSCYYTTQAPDPQGGRLNRYINLPQEYSTKIGSGLDRLKIEALSWGATYRNFDLAAQAIRFPYTQLQWSKSDIRYLVPWFNGGCAWTREYLCAVNEQIPHVNFWALDHLALLSWRLPLPVNARRSRFFG